MSELTERLMYSGIPLIEKRIAVAEWFAQRDPSEWWARRVLDRIRRDPDFDIATAIGCPIEDAYPFVIQNPDATIGDFVKWCDE